MFLSSWNQLLDVTLLKKIHIPLESPPYQTPLHHHVFLQVSSHHPSMIERHRSRRAGSSHCSACQRCFGFFKTRSHLRWEEAADLNVSRVLSACAQTWGLDQSGNCSGWRRRCFRQRRHFQRPCAARLMTSLLALRPEISVNPASLCDDGLLGWMALTSRSIQTSCCL